MTQYYLNRSGHRWRNMDDHGKPEQLLVNDGEKTMLRTVIYWDACGNFAVPCVKIRGKRVKLYAESEVPNEDGSPMVWMPYEVKYPVCECGKPVGPIKGMTKCQDCTWENLKELTD